MAALNLFRDYAIAPHSHFWHYVNSASPL